MAPTGATLDAEIDPMRWNTVYLFEYGTTPAYGEFTEPKSANRSANDHTFHAVSEAIGNLAPGTVYHFRVVAINYTGHPVRARSDIRHAERRRQVDLAVRVRRGTELGASRRPRQSEVDSATTVHFDYGPTAAYGASTASHRHRLRQRVDREAGADIGGLAPNTTYHYRVVATNAHGTVESRDQTFTTAQAAASGEGGEVEVQEAASSGGTASA